MTHGHSSRCINQINSRYRRETVLSKLVSVQLLILYFQKVILWIVSLARENCTATERLVLHLNFMTHAMAYQRLSQSLLKLMCLAFKKKRKNN